MARLQGLLSEWMGVYGSADYPDSQLVTAGIQYQARDLQQSEVLALSKAPVTGGIHSMG